MARSHVGYAMVVLVLAAAGLSGCASGAVTGNVTQAGAPTAPLSMTWTSGIFGESGKISAVMPNGERFSGKYQVVTPGLSRGSVEPEWTGDGPSGSRGQIDTSLWGAAKDHPAFVKTYQNKAIATLYGDRGSTMLCRFNLDAGGAGMGGGGTGECQTSTGAKIPVQF
jgi:hypothetical protein